MAFKLIVIASFLACANAGILGEPAIAYSSAPAVSSAYIHQAPIAVAHAAPLNYAAPSVAFHAPTYGSSHQSVERSLGGAQSVSHYSKAIDSAFSSVRKYDTRITNDALTLSHGPVAYGAPIAKTIAPAYAYSAAPVVTKTYSAPAFAYSSAPVVSNQYIHQAQPLLAKAVAPVATYAAHAPIATYAAQAPLATYTAQAPLAAYASHGPVSYAAPGQFVAKAVAPVLTKASVAYSPATVVAHTTFTGLGTAYEW